MRKLFVIILALCLVLSFAGCNGKTNAGDIFETTAPVQTHAHQDGASLTILFTNDVHAAYARDEEQGRLGYAALASYAQELRDAGKEVLLIDGGDAIQGEAVATLSKGSYIVDLMNETGYTMAVPGNHEFDFGMEMFLHLSEKEAEYPYVSCNFIDLRTGNTVFKPYILKDIGGKIVAFVGISTPETYSKSTPAYFQDENGRFIYGFAQGEQGQELYDCVQSAIDAAVNEGADYVIGVGHTGIDPSSSPWTTVEIIANTTGMVAYLDGHSHSLLEGTTVQDKDDRDVLICSTGSKFQSFGEITLDLDSGMVSSRLIAQWDEDDDHVQEVTDTIYDKFADLLNEIVATSDVNLVTHNPKDEDQRWIRVQETNMGDFCADAYRAVLGADIAFVNGGGIRAEIEKGDVTYGDLINIHPYGNSACLIEATGQEILDALEMSVRLVGVGENGGFLQVSGLTMEVNLAVESGVKVDENGNFREIQGERRVTNVMIGDQPLDPDKTYTLASHDYMLLLGGDGYTMFADNVMLLQEVMVDNQVLITYIRDELNGTITKDLYGDATGQKRIVFVEAE